VACGHPLTAAAAVEILEEGGNAFDAAIAAQFAACVAEPVLASLGGGGFLMAERPGEGARLFDFFAHTPRVRREGAGEMRAIEADFGDATQTFHVGAASVATPGTVAGMFAIHEALGSLPMTRLVEPACRAARQGIPVNEFQGYIFDVVRPIYEGVEPFHDVRTGSTLTQAHLADTLEALAAEGADLFYRGDLARALLQASTDEGGHLTAEDLAAYGAIERPPLTITHRGHEIATNPPPSAGGVLIAHSLEQLGNGAADPEHVLAAMAATRDAREALLAGEDQVSRGTTHISVADAHGSVAAMTLTNGEGSGLMIPGSGIMLNNMLGEEDINPGGIGNWRPDRRLGSMMAPTLILGHGATAGHRYALGSGGSNRIRSAILQVIVHLLDHGRPPQAAVDAPRLHLEDDLLSFEPGLEGEALARLAGLDCRLHPWSARNLFFGGVHLVGAHPGAGPAGETDRFQAAGDPRRGGVGRIAGDR
jgi:gamma-glutamyltranspeptidase/glutathione hydrolase